MTGWSWAQSWRSVRILLALSACASSSLSPPGSAVSRPPTVRRVYYANTSGGLQEAYLPYQGFPGDPWHTQSLSANYGTPATN
ncbi:MAG TPA: hypothetical protein VEJ84_18895 [Acidimicrobiales bacterium]|nr:hypothetical protein [Acidimicrobiales bacterium]